MTHVLITQGASPFAQRIARQFPADYRITFGVAGDVPEVLIRTGKYNWIPPGNAPGFTHSMLNACLDGGIGLLLPLGWEELVALARAAQLFSEYQIEVLVPPLQLLETIPIYTNPVKEAVPAVLLHGCNVHDGAVFMEDFPYSGVYLQGDDGDTPALCCLNEN